MSSTASASVSAALGSAQHKTLDELRTALTRYREAVDEGSVSAG